MPDVYRLDLATKTFDLASVTTEGRYLGTNTFCSTSFANSRNGRFALLRCSSDNNFYLRDFENKTTTKVDLPSSPYFVANVSYAVSSDGRYITFHTVDKLAPEDTNSVLDIYQYDRQTQKVELISQSTEGRSTENGIQTGRVYVSDDNKKTMFTSSSKVLDQTPPPPSTSGVPLSYVRYAANVCY